MKAWAALHVESIEETVTFYCAAFGFVAVAPQADFGCVTLILDESELNFIEMAHVERLSLDDVEAPLAALPQGSEIVLAIEYAMFAELFSQAIDAGALPVRPPSPSGDGRQEAFLRDPNGFLIRLRQGDMP